VNQCFLQWLCGRNPKRRSPILRSFFSLRGPLCGPSVLWLWCCAPLKAPDLRYGLFGLQTLTTKYIRFGPLTPACPNFTGERVCYHPCHWHRSSYTTVCAPLRNPFLATFDQGSDVLGIQPPPFLPSTFPVLNNNHAEHSAQLQESCSGSPD